MKSLNLSALLGVPELDKYLSKVEATMSSCIDTDNQWIKDPCIRFIVSKSKRLRPSLVIAITKSLGQAVDQDVITVAASVELAHLGSLVHDDIIDNASLRHGEDTVSAKYGVENAIIVGDYLLSKATQLASSVSARHGEIMAKAITELCDGESYEYNLIFNQSKTLEQLYYIMDKKTAALFSASSLSAGILAGSESVNLKRLEAFGKEFGRSFQIIDDVLDFIASSKLIGKPVGGDITEGIYTLALLLAIKEKQVVELLNSGSVSDLIEALIKEGYIDKAISKAYECAEIASKEISSVSPVNKYMKEFPLEYVNWALDHYVLKG